MLCQGPIGDSGRFLDGIVMPSTISITMFQRFRAYAYPGWQLARPSAAWRTSQPTFQEPRAIPVYGLISAAIGGCCPADGPKRSMSGLISKRGPQFNKSKLSAYGSPPHHILGGLIKKLPEFHRFYIATNFVCPWS